MTKKKTAKKPGNKRAKVTTKVSPDDGFFVASELADDKQIEQEVMNQTTKAMVYEYSSNGLEPVYGLSYQGVKEAVRNINRMRNSGYRIKVSRDSIVVERNVTIQGQEGVSVRVYAEDQESGGGYWGVKFEPYNRPVFDGRGGTEPNRFAEEIALSKAERNALFKLLPAALIEKMVNKFLKDSDAVQKTTAPKTETKEIEPKASKCDKMYKATLDRVGQIKNDKKALEQALKKIDNMPINSKQRGQIRRKISTYIKKIK